MSVLKGMRVILNKVKPDLHVEIHPEMLRRLGEDADDVLAFLSAADYNCFDMEGQRVNSMADLLGTCLNAYCVHRSGARNGELPSI